MLDALLCIFNLYKNYKVSSIPFLPRSKLSSGILSTLCEASQELWGGLVMFQFPRF
jgi:hypothetical protein